jgi:hypothetical protein
MILLNWLYKPILAHLTAMENRMSTATDNLAAQVTALQSSVTALSTALTTYIASNPGAGADDAAVTAAVTQLSTIQAQIDGLLPELAVGTGTPPDTSAAANLQNLGNAQVKDGPV